MKNSSLLAVIALACCLFDTSGFIVRQGSAHGLSPREQKTGGTALVGVYHAQVGVTHPALCRQRRSVANVQTQGLFGLGGLEIGVILVVVAFVIGPQNLGSMLGQLKGGLDEVPDELKKIPEEFKKGIEEGETNARARKAKQMDILPEDKD